jgi:hypothetical protein
MGKSSTIEPSWIALNSYEQHKTAAIQAGLNKPDVSKYWTESGRYEDSDMHANCTRGDF